MCEGNVVSADPINTYRRRNLWDTRGFQCSIIGTCLNRSEIRKLTTKKVFRIPSGLADHEIHSTLVNWSSRKCNESRALQKIFNKKYQTIVTKFSKVKTDAELVELWKGYLDSGVIAGAYWAIMTHPALTNDTAYEIHGEIHMIGHDSTAQYQIAKRQLAEARKKGLVLEKELGISRQNNCQNKEKLEAESEHLNAAREQQKQQVETIRLLTTRMADMEKMLSSADTGEASQELKTQNDSLRLENNQLNEHSQQLTYQIDDLQHKLYLAQNSADGLQEKNDSLIGEKALLQQDLQSMEGFLSFKMESDTDTGTLWDCENCEAGANCAEQGLCGKTVLYVGGQYKMVPRYKQLVEQFGGTFLHHDGGQETARHILPKFLSRADAVLCPVDCVSHDACKCVKKMCKRYQKNYVMMRSSGLSSLARGLQEIAQ